MTTGDTPVTIREARASDAEAMLALYPRLADFDVPAHREPRHLWSEDAALLRRWLAGEAPQCRVLVADVGGEIAGTTLTTLRPDPLSKAPGAHLEVIVVAPGFEGRGIGRQLLAAAEDNARRHGAAAMTLHVIATNQRARDLYEYSGYNGELLRYYKAL